MEPFSADFSLGAWNDFGKFTDNEFGEGVESLSGVSLQNNEKWDSYIDDGGWGLPPEEEETQAPYSFISSTEQNPSYDLGYSLEPSNFDVQSPLEDMGGSKESNWTELVQQVCQEKDQSYYDTQKCSSKNDEASNCEVSSLSSSEVKASEATKPSSVIDCNTFSPSDIEDLKGSTSAQGRKMTAEERALMLYKRKLRNRESAAKTRKKRAKTLNQIGHELEELREKAELLDERSSLVRRTEEENKKLVEENSHLRNVINQYAVELSTVRYKLKLLEGSADIAKVGGMLSKDVLSMSTAQKGNAAVDASYCCERPQETKGWREFNSRKDNLAYYSNEKEAEALQFTPFSSEVTTLDVLEQVSNQQLGAFSGRDRRRAIAATNVFLRERSMN
ncbi:hypothetical protein GAYE_PCTG14G0618 [Galdieria yellowstonensis]|uniref:BZIP domain-containing protein n=1 Tax=Galdieria yellowstonensis TaxID=3028027 RepID=A0AAV9I6Q5_9RHOD|nr:hypothetical protein GAYE_PCTG14G0618 [Galdieria yellowstonensis]